MYIPSYTAAPDSELPYDLMREEPFAALITSAEKDGARLPEVNHYPFQLEREAGPRGVLWTHLARANPQYRRLRESTECLVVFQGPHAYISPRHYEGVENVPTWNYAVVQARCKIELIEDAAGIDRILGGLVDRFEAEAGREGAWKYEVPEGFRQGLLRAIAGVRLEILSLEGKFKLSQNRDAADYARVLAHFASRADDRGRAVHRYMERTRPAR